MESSERYLAEHKPTLAVVQAVADAENVDPAALDPPLYSVVEPEALNQLVSHDGTLDSISFAYRGHHVTVSGNGTVHVQ